MMKKITIVSLFPQVFETLLNFSILKRAQDKGKVSFEIIDLREFGEGVHQVVDGRPYGGGAGMVLKADILAKALKYIVNGKSLIGKNHKPKIVLTSASGATFKQAKARELSKLEHLIIICGHYEGVDQRFIEKYVDEEISIGDYVLTGGELPALVISDAVTRLIPEVLEKEESTLDESFENNFLEYPQYTRPEEFEGEKVPEVLKSGNHEEIKKWRQEKSLQKTKKLRPDLLKNPEVSS